MLTVFPWKARQSGAPSLRALSLIETLVTMAIGASLVAFVVAGFSGVIDRSKSAQCLNRMKQLGSGILLYTQDHDGELPRSLHSAAGAGQQPWAKAILPYLGYDPDPSASQWEQLFNKVYRCPTSKTRDVNIYSYALNVHFELTPDGDDYAGAPAQWRRLANIERPASTVLLAEPKEVYYADHVMCHTWTSLRGATNAIDGQRHRKTSNYVFVDGHISSSAVSGQYDPAKSLNNWNPSLAGKL